MSETNQGTEGILATIVNSGSTNTGGYNIVIHNDGSATAVIKGKLDPMIETREFSPGTIDTKTLRSVLAAIGDVSKIPTGLCVKPASFASRTTISYAGMTSGDLQSIPQEEPGVDQSLLQESKDLYSFVQAIVRQLKINDVHVSSGQ